MLGTVMVTAASAALLASDPTDTMAWIERLGSFGVIVALLFWGGPKILAETKAARVSFLTALEKRDEQFMIEHDKTMLTLAALTAEIKYLSGKIDDHSRRLDLCPHQHVAPGRG